MGFPSNTVQVKVMFSPIVTRSRLAVSLTSGDAENCNCNNFLGSIVNL